MTPKALPALRRILHCLPGLIILPLMLCSISGCGSDDAENRPGISADTTTASGTSIAMLHDTGVELFASGLASDDLDAIIQAIDMLEQAAVAASSNNVYWLDLADAYMNSGLATEYPYAIETYWMLYQDRDPQADAILARLADAYQEVGNRKAAFDVAAERLKKANEKQSGSAGLQLTLLAFANGGIDKTVELLVDKANDLDEPGTLLMLAASLKELASDREAALDLVEDALDELDKNSPSVTLAEQMRGRLSP